MRDPLKGISVVIILIVTALSYVAWVDDGVTPESMPALGEAEITYLPEPEDKWWGEPCLSISRDTGVVRLYADDRETTASLEQIVLGLQALLEPQRVDWLNASPVVGVQTETTWQPGFMTRAQIGFRSDGALVWREVGHE